MLELLGRSRRAGQAAFVPFLVAGDPSLDETERLVDVLVEEGVECLELGVPFSDALADGPVIQAASERAARRVDSIRQVIELSARIHARHAALQIILFTYYNPILKLGVETFAAEARRAGVAAVLVVDLPPEHAGEYRATLAKHDLKTVFLASPTTSPERLRQVAEASTGFIYYVSRVGVTGVQNELSGTLAAELKALREITDRPIAVGFGISSGAQARQVAALADAVVVGSAFVRLVAENPDPERARAAVRALAAELIAGTKGT